MCLITKPTKQGLQWKYQFETDDLQAEEIPDSSGFKNQFEVRTSKGLLFRYSSTSNQDRLGWIFAFRDAALQNRYTKAFGTPISKMLEHLPSSNGIPLFFEKCIKYLENHIQTEGLFRVNGPSKEVKALRAEIEGGGTKAVFKS